MKARIISLTKRYIFPLTAMPILFLCLLCGFGCAQKNGRFVSPSVLLGKEYIRIPPDSSLLHQIHLIRFEPPQYPKQFLVSNLEPDPNLFLKIDRYGYVDGIGIIDSPDTQVDKAILKVASKWVFQLPDENPNPGPFHITCWLFYHPSIKKYRSFNLVPSLYLFKYIRKPLPIYPEKAARKKLRDTIVIDASTDIYGKVIEIKVKQGKHKLLIDSAKDAFKRWIFEPYILCGVPRPFRFTSVVQFPGKKKNFGSTAEYIKIIDASPPFNLQEKREETISKGEHSIVITYFAEGSKKYEESFYKDVRHGSFHGWYQDGSKRIQGILQRTTLWNLDSLV